MKPVVCAATIEAPAGNVFDVVGDIPHAADTISGIESIEMLTDGPVGEGTRWRETRTFFGKTADETMWITEWEPPLRYVAEARNHGTHYLTEVAVEDLGDGRSRLTFSMLAEPETLMSRVLMVAFSWMRGHVVKAFEADLQDVKRACEADGVSASD
ncbi:MAG: SRPBCC family protein [Planctomycetota bacterium]